MIYEYLCEDEPILIPDSRHSFFREHKRKLDVYDGGEEEIADELDDLRNRAIFQPKWVGTNMAKEITKLWLEKNEFHFRDARRFMLEFVATRFPCDYLPKNHLRNLTVFIRCEDFLEWAGWEPDYQEGGTPDQDYEWNEVGIYTSQIANRIPDWLTMRFEKKPNITLVIVTPFGQWGAEYIEEQRILLNFQIAVLPSYEDLKKIGAKVKVVTKTIVSLTHFLEWTEDEDVTWQLELASKLYEVCLRVH